MHTTDIILYNEKGDEVNLKVNWSDSEDVLEPEGTPVDNFQLNYIDVEDDSIDIIKGLIKEVESDS